MDPRAPASAGVPEDRGAAAVCAANAGTSTPVDFIESKLPDFDRVRQLLQPSADCNHWSNGGPLSRRLEAFLEERAMPAGSRAVVCASGTAALQALTGLTEYRAGRRLRWVGSAFSFLSSFIGNLSDSVLVDSDDLGRLSLDRLALFPDEGYDAVLLTNPFGLYADWTEHLRFCAARGKRVVLDHAAGFPSDGRAEFLRSVPYFLSFHQTKPWGAGEGGAIVVSEGDADVARGLINFAAGMPPAARSHAFNGKLSDLSCAYILDRLERFADWSKDYERQKRRILDLVRRSGLPLTPLGPRRGFDACGPIGHLPLLADRRLTMEDLPNPHLVLRKYYRPGADGFPVAQSLFDRMLNLPCHRDMQNVDDATIVAALSHVLEAADKTPLVPPPRDGAAVAPAVAHT